MDNNLNKIIELIAKQSGNEQPRQQPENVERQNDTGPSSSTVPFKIEAKVEIPIFGGDVNTKKFENWLK